MSTDPCRELLRALTEYLGPIEDLTTRTRDWSSATFTGMLHDLSFSVQASTALIASLPEIDMPMNGHFVADLRVISATPQQVTIEVLTIAET